MIELSRVSRAYQRGSEKVQALEGVDLKIASGSFVALMGPSGSGKSTLLNLVAGLDNPSSGTVRVGDLVLNDLSEEQLASWRATHLGFIFQFYNLLPVLSAAENVEMPLLLTRLSRVERRSHVGTALGIVGLGHRKDHFPNQMSGGEQQRVAIARAIVADPELIVADEPTGDLDAQNANGILDLLRQLKHGLNKTILIATHDSRAESYVDYTIHLDKGLLTDKGTPSGTTPGVTNEAGANT